MTIRPERLEDGIQILILITIGGMAGAASFTHVHDWTMHHSPPGTGGWFGWANAVISELTPTAAGLEIRRRKRHHAPIAYPMAVLIAAAVLSLSAQVAEATPTITGWLVAAVPALAFLALSKLILSRTTTKADQPSAAAADSPSPAGIPATSIVTPAAEPDPEPSAQLLTSARMAAFAHQQATGQPITADGLADHFAISPALAGTLLHHLDGTPSPSVTAANGTPVTGSGL
jgi:hypothetical protein